MASRVPPDPGFEARVRASFGRQRAMALLGAALARVAPGEVDIALPFRADLTQQDGLLHAGVVAAVLDSAGGYAASTLLPAGHDVLTADLQLHYLAPAAGERLEARGRVVRAGRTLTVCELTAEVARGGARMVCAWGSQTVVGRAR